VNLQVGVKAIITNDKNEYLFLRRSASKYPGKDKRWDIPGGRIEPEESLADALVREVKEETNLDVDTANLRLVAAQDIFVQDKNFHAVRLTYYANATGDVHLSEEHTEYVWLSKQDALESELDQYVREVFENE